MERPKLGALPLCRVEFWLVPFYPLSNESWLGVEVCSHQDKSNVQCHVVMPRFFYFTCSLHFKEPCSLLFRFSICPNYPPNNTDHLINNIGPAQLFFHCSFRIFVPKQYGSYERSASPTGYSRTETFASGILRFRWNPVYWRLGGWSRCVSWEIWRHESNHERVDFVRSCNS